MVKFNKFLFAKLSVTGMIMLVAACGRDPRTVPIAEPVKDVRKTAIQQIDREEKNLIEELLYQKPSLDTKSIREEFAALRKKTLETPSKEIAELLTKTEMRIEQIKKDAMWRVTEE